MTSSLTTAESINTITLKNEVYKKTVIGDIVTHLRPVWDFVTKSTINHEVLRSCRRSFRISAK